MHLSAICSFISLLIRSSIIFIISILGNGIEATILRLEDTGRVATTRSIAEITSGAVAVAPVDVVTGFVTLNAHATEMGAVLLLLFSCALHVQELYLETPYLKLLLLVLVVVVAFW